MKKLLTMLVLICSCSSFAQIIMFDETDEFTGTRAISIRNSESKEISLTDDTIIIDSTDHIFLMMDLNVSKDKKESLIRFILGIVSTEPKCYKKSDLSILFESGEVKTIKQESPSTCDVVAAVGYSLSDKDLIFLQNNKIKKIRVTNEKGQEDYTINPEKQKSIQETCKLAYTKLQEMRK